MFIRGIVHVSTRPFNAAPSSIGAVYFAKQFAHCAKPTRCWRPGLQVKVLRSAPFPAICSSRSSANSLGNACNWSEGTTVALLTAAARRRPRLPPRSTLSSGKLLSPGPSPAGSAAAYTCPWRTASSQVRLPAVRCAAGGERRSSSSGSTSSSKRVGGGSKKRGSGSGGKPAGKQQQQPQQRKKQQEAEAPCLVPPLASRVLSDLSSSDRMPEPLWSTFCGVSNGLWCGITAAYSPSTGRPGA